MNKSSIVALSVAIISAVILFSMTAEPENTQFAEWKSQYNKAYTSHEEAYRMRIWLSNLAFVTEHNARHEQGLESYTVHMNEFADLTQKEFAQRYLISYPIEQTTSCSGSAKVVDTPNEVNWTKDGSVTGVKNQGQCGSCWAFSSTGSLEGMHKNHGSELTSLSEQELVDCSKSYGNHGCGGGLMNMSFWYVKDHGLGSEKDYSYRMVGGACKAADVPRVIEANKVDCYQVPVDDSDALKKAVAAGPVSVAIQANHLAFQMYHSGVFDNKNCGHKLDHGVLAVGYGSEGGKDYWLVKNSWGAGWGKSGYIMMARNTEDKHGMCGIQMAASYPVYV